MRGVVWASSLVVMLGIAAPGAGEPAASVRLPVVANAQTVVVESGDHLWKISARHLRERLGDEALSVEVAPYWLEVVAVNTPRLRSGDPDLIYTGEVVILPVISGR